MTRTRIAALVLLFGTWAGALHAQVPMETIPDDSAIGTRTPVAPTTDGATPDGAYSSQAPQGVGSAVSSYWLGGHGPGCQEHCTSCRDKLCAYFTYCRKKCPCSCWGCCNHGCFPRPYLFFIKCYSGIGGPYPPCCDHGGCKGGCRGCGGCGGGSDGPGGCATCGH